MLGTPRFRVPSEHLKSKVASSKFKTAAGRHVFGGKYCGDVTQSQSLRIHMNGRIYDPKLGRMLQADPIVQSPSNIQNYNRYSYVLNNPLKYTDPSGYNFFNKVFDDILGLDHLPEPLAQIGVAVGSFFCGPWAPACAAGGSFAVASGNGASFSQALEACAIAGVSAFAFQQIGAEFATPGAMGPPGPGEMWFGGNLMSYGRVAMQIGAHAVAGGVMADLQGGKFGHGFVAAGLTKGVTGYFSGGSVPSRFIAATIVGGTASELTGGKFANGAITASYQFLFNEAWTAKKLGEVAGELRADIEKSRYVNSLNVDVENDRAALALHMHAEGEMEMGSDTDRIVSDPGYAGTQKSLYLLRRSRGMINTYTPKLMDITSENMRSRYNPVNVFKPNSLKAADELTEIIMPPQ